MVERRETGLLYAVFILLLMVVVGSLVYKDRLVDWAHMQPGTKALLICMWTLLILLLFQLVLVFFLGKLRNKREDLRITLLRLTILSCFMCLLLEIGTYTQFYGGQRCFPYNLNVGLSFHPAFLPLSITIDEHGRLSVSGDTSFPVEIGEIGIVADPANPPDLNDDSTDANVTVLVIRHHEGNHIVDTSYKLHSRLDSVQIVTTGFVVTQVKKNYYFIDASQGQIESTQVNIFPANKSCSTVTAS